MGESEKLLFPVICTCSCRKVRPVPDAIDHTSDTDKHAIILNSQKKECEEAATDLCQVK